MKYTGYCLGLCAVGLVLVVLGLLWTNVVGNPTVWSEAQALTFNEVSATYHQAAHEAMDHHGHAHEPSSASANLEAAKKAWEEQMQARDAAIARRDFWKTLLFGGGMSAILIGGAGYLIARNVADDS